MSLNKSLFTLLMILALTFTLNSSDAATNNKKISVAAFGGAGYWTSLALLGVSGGATIAFKPLTHLELGVSFRYDGMSFSGVSSTIVSFMADIRWRISADRGFWIGADIGYGSGRVSAGAQSITVNGLIYELSTGYDIPIGSFSIGPQIQLVPPYYLVGAIALKAWF